MKHFPKKKGGVMEIKFGFELHDGFLPKKYTCEALDVSPCLIFKDVPVDAVTLALISDDPDAVAGDWVHWIIFNIPGRCKGLPEGMQKARELSDGTRQGVNDFGNIGWNGPCPPAGTHIYYFKLYALNCTLDLATGATKAELEDVMRGHIISKAVAEVRYRKS